MALLNYAVASRDSRDIPLLMHNPLKGLPYPSEDNPRRPMLADDRYQKMREVGARVHPRCESFFVVVHETGHRAASVRQLKWSDIDLNGRTVKWRPDADKINFEHETPLTDDAVEALQSERRRRTTLSDTWCSHRIVTLRNPFLDTLAISGGGERRNLQRSNTLLGRAFIRLVASSHRR